MAFPSTLDDFTNKTDNEDYVLAGDINELQGAGASSGGIEAIEYKLGIDGSAVVTSIDYLLKNASSIDPGHSHSLVTNFIASGRKIYLYENTAPTGWTIEAVTDAVLAVKGGSQAYNVTGGQLAGTWTQSSHSHSFSATSETPSATEQAEWGSGGTYAKNDHTHSVSGYTGTSATQNTYRPYAAIGIIVSKD